VQGEEDRDERLIWMRDPNSKGAIAAIICPTAETAAGVYRVYNIIYIYTVAADKSSFADVIECIRRTVSDRARRGSRVRPSPETTPLWNARWAAGDTIRAR